MRIIAGDSRGVRLASLPGEATRPTLERVKEAMFSTIQFILPGAKVLDLYAGSGQMGLEALSRGAASCVFVDNAKEAAEIILKNARAAGLQQKARVVRQNAGAFLASGGEGFDIMLLDPPYGKNVLPQILPMAAQRCNAGAVVLCEGEAGAEMPRQAGTLCLKKQYRYGTVSVGRYEQAPTNETEDG